MIAEDSPATDVHAPSPFHDQDGATQKQQQLLKNKGGHILLQSLSTPHGYFQDSPLTLHQSLACLTALADLHASAWGNVALLQKIDDRLSSAGGSYHLKFRNPKELKGLVSSWKSFHGHFLRHFVEGGKKKEGEKDWSWLLNEESVRLLGQRVYDMAEYVSKELTPRFDEKYATLVQGDFKSMVSLECWLSFELMLPPWSCLGEI